MNPCEYKHNCYTRSRSPGNCIELKGERREGCLIRLEKLFEDGLISAVYDAKVADAQKKIDSSEGRRKNGRD